VTSRLRTAAALVGLSTLLALTACSAAPAGTTGDPDTGESTAPVAAPETACPDGFVEAYAAAASSSYDPGFTVTEVSADAFAPDFLAPFTDGGCSVHITGVITGVSAAAPVDGDFGFAPDAATADAIAEALEANGYEADPDFPGGFRSDTGFAGVYLIDGDVTGVAQDVLDQFYPNGVVFYA
jgi:hypothetical protein